MDVKHPIPEENRPLPTLAELVHTLGDTAKKLLTETNTADHSTISQLKSVMNFAERGEALAIKYSGTTNSAIFVAMNIISVKKLQTSLNSIDEKTWMPKIETKGGKVNEIDFQLCKAMTDTVTTIKNNSEHYFPHLSTKQDHDLKSTLGIMQGAGEKALFKAKPELEVIIDAGPKKK
jgi:hypothetical protein